MRRFKITNVDVLRHSIQVAYGPISFVVFVDEKENAPLQINKPTSIYITQPDFYELIGLVRTAWQTAMSSV